MNVVIRRTLPDDLTVIEAIYRDSIRHLGPSVYSPAQVAAWARFADDAVAFRAWIATATTFVAVGAGGPIGFGGLQSGGRIASLFVAPAAMRQGVASRLLEHLLAEARSRGFHDVTAHASEFSRSLFVRYGFSVAVVEHTVVSGVEFSRYAMRAEI
jgi:putative acetyltransferase